MSQNSPTGPHCFKAAIDSISSAENAPYAGLPLLLLDVAIRSRLESELDPGTGGAFAACAGNGAAG